MSKRIEKTDNYFERVKQRADRDGCQASRCYLRIGGGWWFCPATFFCATAYGRIYVWVILSQCFCFFAYSSLSDTGKPVCRH